MRHFLPALAICLAGTAAAQGDDPGRLDPAALIEKFSIALSEPEDRTRPVLRPALRIEPALERRAEDLRPGPLRAAGLVRSGAVAAGFVLGELILVADSPAAAEAAAARIGTPIGAPLRLTVGTPEGRTLSLLRVRLDPRRAPDDAVFDRVEAASPHRFTRVYEVSSEAARDTLTAALDLQLAGEVSVGLNWIFEPVALDNEILLEGVTPAGAGFVNPFDLPYLNGEGAARIGVTGAWHLLKAAGLLDDTGRAMAASRIPLAVIDQGFHDALDLSMPEIRGAAAGRPGDRACAGGAVCPWHGSHVAEIMAAPVGNMRAVAGPAGPVAGPVELQTLDGFESWSLLAWIADRTAPDAAAVPRVVNMSFAATVPDLWAWSTVALDLGIAALDRAGTLAVAAAGNDRADIDAVRCVEGVPGACHETARRVPCELTGVVCVGALGQDDVRIAEFSAVGAMPGTPGQDGDSIDIYAPGVAILAGADPGAGTSPPAQGWTQALSGSSVAAPLVAGVAALIAAADPGLGADALRGLLLNGAWSGATDLPPGQAPDPRLGRFLNAERPVRLALAARFAGTDFPPLVEIVRPRPGLGMPAVQMGSKLDVEARSVDVEEGIGCCAPRWTVDGLARPDLSGPRVGIVLEQNRSYEIGVTVTDGAGQTASDTMTVRARP
ncbi:hypothetical protein BYZ73_03525 [Rhodovulum viride]|uniref:Peptidase S8/S53 domain-containing protein n=1 Tax=Rhodovulum viride TaxID=1231134 RepID=A0ABX9DK32_9RHOB|nr:S8 family serine peptidase [Rhodovulum viride]RAP42745.1 hypothetical protein BYZ73_03525 [Rhodovulum viride]